MTSKRLFWTNWIQENKNMFWLYAVHFFLISGLGILSILPDLPDNLFATEGIPEVYEIVGFSSYYAFFYAILGLVTGIGCFSYLNSAKKVDFYHSQPISKPKRFLSLYTIGLVTHLIPCLLNLLLELLVIGICGGMNQELLLHMLASAFLNTMAFFIAYQIAVLTTILTKNNLYSIGLFLIFIAYESTVSSLVEGFIELFFNKYMALTHYWVSPLNRFFIITDFMNPHEISGSIVPEFSATALSLVWPLILSLVIGLLAFFAYTKRPLEYTTPTLAFEKHKPVLKVFLMIVCCFFALHVYYSNYIPYQPVEKGIGLFFLSVFILLITLFVGHFVIELFLELDIQKTKKHFGSTFIAGGCILFLFILLFVL